LFQTARGSGATLSDCTFSLKKRTSLKDFFQERPLQGFSSKEPRTSLFHLARPKETKRLLSSTMKRSGTCRYGTHRVPHRYYYEQWALAWPTSLIGEAQHQTTPTPRRIDRISRTPNKKNTFYN
jgi:hypothetical protein